MTVSTGEAPSTLSSVGPEGLTLDELASRIGGRVFGDGAIKVRAVRALGAASPVDLSFLHAPAYREEALASAAGALLVPDAMAGDVPSLGKPAVVVADSHVALAHSIELFHPRHVPAPGVHPTAVVDTTAVVGDGAHLGPYVVIGAGSAVGDRAVVEAHVVVGRGCSIGADAWIHPSVVLYDGTQLGDRVEVHSGTVLGADGFGYATDKGVHRKVPQVGHVVLEEDVEVGANSAIDRALLEETRIGAGSKIDNLVQVGHNVRTGRGCLLCGQAGIAGSSELGDYVVLAGQAGVIDHMKIGDQVQVAAKSAVYQDIPAGTKAGGIPATDLRSYRRQIAVQSKLPGLLRRLRKLERQLGEGGGGGG
ncbi:MAG: UDP-3-O-(3-hydroxymyristoyl)glucosamine N-acyltransferase [Acidobacteriota bacterium]